MSQMGDPYLAMRERLKAQAEDIKQSEPVTLAGVWLDKYSPGKRGVSSIRPKTYVKLSSLLDKAEVAR